MDTTTNLDAQIESFVGKLYSEKSLSSLSAEQPLRVTHLRLAAAHDTTTLSGNETVNLSTQSFSDANAIETWLKDESLQGQPGLIQYSISQPRSRSSLNICQRTLQNIMRTHKLSPRTLNFASSMYPAIRKLEEAYCSPFLSQTIGDVTEYGYMAKYVQQPNANRPKDWRIRQTAILHQFNKKTKSSVVILLNPHPSSIIEQASLRKIEAVKTLGDCEEFHPWLDATFFDLHMPAWRQYNRQSETTLQVLAEDLNARRQREKSVVSSKMLEDATAIEDSLIPLEAIFVSLIDTLEGLSSLYRVLEHGTPTMKVLQNLQSDLTYQEAQIVAYQQATRFLLKKHGSFLHLFDKTFASQQERIMLDDSATIKVITMITFIYLSFTVVGTIFSMPLFYLERNTHTLVVAKDIWKFFVISVPLTALSILYWRFMTWWRRRGQGAIPNGAVDERSSVLISKQGLQPV